MLYKEWIKDASIGKEWMVEEGFFLGLPLDSEDAPIDEVMREAVYRYIEDAFGGSRLSLSDHERWAEIFRARLTELNGSFWKQMQMDLLARIKDLVTADYSEYIQNYGRSVSDTSSTGDHESTTEHTDDATIGMTTEPVVNTTTDSMGTKETTTTTPTTAGRQVQLNSQLAEATYLDPIISDGEGLAGMPTMDTTHGDTAHGAWTLEGGNKIEVEREAPTGQVEQVQGKIEQEQTESGEDFTETKGKNSNTSNTVNANIGGVLREGHRDFNGYALQSSIEAVQRLLPYNFLKNGLSSLFRSARSDDLWL